jgi:hypothetical protein
MDHPVQSVPDRSMTVDQTGSDRGQTCARPGPDRGPVQRWVGPPFTQNRAV